MKQIIILGTFSVANIFIGFLFQWYVLTQLGAGVATDALFASMTIPQLVLTVISGSLMHVLVPMLTGGDRGRLHHDAWGFLILIGGLFFIIASALYMTATWWIPLIVPGFDKPSVELTIELTRIQLYGLVFSSISGVQLAAYHARQEFVWAEFSGVLATSASMLLLVWALPRFGVTAAAWIGVSRFALQVLLLSPAMGKPIRPNLTNPAFNTAWQKIKPLLLGATYYKTDTLVDRLLLSMASTGNLSLYYFAHQIYSAANQIINKSIAGPLVPHLSKLYVIGDYQGFRNALNLTLIRTGLLTVLAFMSLVFFGDLVLELLVGYGKFSLIEVNDLWWIMLWLGGMFVGGALGQLSSSSFYASGDTTTPTRISIFTYTLYVPLKIFVFFIYGVKGIAITTSVYYMVNFFLQVIVLDLKKHNE